MVQRFWKIMVLLVLLTACTAQVDSSDTMQEGVQEPPGAEDVDAGMMVEGADAEDTVVEEESKEDMVVEESQESMVDKTFVFTGENFRFLMDGEEDPDLRVNLGDRVRIEFSSTQGFHDWVVDEFDAATQRVKPEDGVSVVEFTADKAGTFNYYCSVGSHRADGMEGNLIVS